jgi:hypothetical protein
MPMAPFTHIDFDNHIAAIIAVGVALEVDEADLPSSTASANHMSDLYWINKLRVSQTLAVLPPLPSLDYTGFQPALNVLAALVE